MDIYPGIIVYSKSGRDKNKYFVVIEAIDEQYVYIADGNLRKLEKPKKKKIKHLKVTEFVTNDIMEKINNKDKITNSELRKIISELE